MTAELVARYNTATFEDLVEIHLRAGRVSEEFMTKFTQCRVASQQRGQHMMDMFQRQLARYYTIPGTFLSVDIGCGAGAASSVLAQRFTWVVGVDPYLPDLILARKFFADQKIHNVVLVQAYAQNIPVRDHCVDYAVAQNVIEHLIDVGPAFYELRRILRQGGCFCGDSRNRFDLFFPEPHVGLRWVGLLPRKLQPWYVYKRRALRYTHTALLSCWELHRYARRSFGRSTRVVFPLASAYGQSPKFDRWIERIERLPILKQALLLFFPSHLLLAQANLTGGSSPS